MGDVAEAKINRILSFDEKGIALKKLVSQMVGDINAWTEKESIGAFGFKGRITYKLNQRGNNEACYLIHKQSLFTKTPIGIISASIDKKNIASLKIVIYPIRNLDAKYTVLFNYLTTKKNIIRTYGAVFYNKVPSNVTVEISAKELN